jgi:hypothetical protein
LDTENGLGLGAGRIQAKKKQKQKQSAPEEVIEVNSETDEAGPGPGPSTKKIHNEQSTKDSEKQPSSRESAIVSTPTLQPTLPLSFKSSKSDSELPNQVQDLASESAPSMPMVCIVSLIEFS